MRRLLLVLLSIGLATAGCKPSASGSTFAPSQGELITFDDISGACAISTAWGGRAGGDPVPQLKPCAKPPSGNYTGLPAGSIVTTSSCGEAWLSVAGCGTVYVFQATKFVASSCDPNHQSQAGCIAAGTAAWASSCFSDLQLGTPSASVMLSGTWASITYVEDRRLSLVVIVDGNGEAVPVLDVEATQDGDQTELRSGEFWFSAPGDDPPVIGDLEGRVAQPLDQLPAVIDELGLQSWYAEVLARASVDGFDLAEQVRIPVLQVRFAGGSLEDPAAAEAVRTGFDWRSGGGLLPEGDALALVGLAGSEPPVDLRTVGFDPDFAAASIQEVGSFGLEVVWVKGELDPLAAAFVEAMRNIGLDPSEHPVADATEAAQAFDDGVEREGAVVWLARP